jgi:hypothetical protein
MKFRPLACHLNLSRIAMVENLGKVMYYDRTMNKTWQASVRFNVRKLVGKWSVFWAGGPVDGCVQASLSRGKQRTAAISWMLRQFLPGGPGRRSCAGLAAWQPARGPRAGRGRRHAVFSTVKLSEKSGGMKQIQRYRTVRSLGDATDALRRSPNGGPMAGQWPGPQ